MSCEECEKAQDGGASAYYRIDVASVEVCGCSKHLGKMFSRLNNYDALIEEMKAATEAMQTASISIVKLKQQRNALLDVLKAIQSARDSVHRGEKTVTKEMKANLNKLLDDAIAETKAEGSALGGHIQIVISDLNSKLTKTEQQRDVLLTACEFAFTTYDDGLTDNERELFPQCAKEYDMLKEAIAEAKKETGK